MSLIGLLVGAIITSEHYPVLVSQLGRWPGDDKPEPEDDDGLTGPHCETCNGTGIVYSDPDHHLLTCGDCEGEGRTS